MEPNQAPLQGLQQTNCWFGLINLEISGFPQSSCTGVKFLPRFACANPSPSLWNGAEPGFEPCSCSQTTAWMQTHPWRVPHPEIPKSGGVSGGLVTAAVSQGCHVFLSHCHPQTPPRSHQSCQGWRGAPEEFISSSCRIQQPGN